MNSNQTFYSGLLEWDSLKITFVAWHVIVSCIGPCLLYAVIWYERNSPDLLYRTILNQILSLCCWIEIASIFTVKNANLSFFVIGPMSYIYCDVAIGLGNFLFVLIFQMACTRQIIKFFYIFQWKHAANISDDFFALFAVCWNIAMSALFVFAIYFLGYHNENLNYHICTGKNPIENINRTLSQLSYVIDEQLLPNWFQPNIKSDPLKYFSDASFAILTFISCQICWYSNREKTANSWKRIKLFFSCAPAHGQVGATIISTNQVSISPLFYVQLLRL